MLLILFVIVSCAPQSGNSQTGNPASDPLPSWNDGRARQTIIDFVAATTDTNSADFIPAGERIAVFDNDGTLWGEQPLYFQMQFAIDRVKALAPQHPEWNDEQPFKAVLENDMHTLMASGIEGLLHLVMATHAGMSTEEFQAVVKEWITTARHPETGLLYTEMVYQPMLELLEYLRANGYKTWIVSGGGIGFMRPWTEAVYGIPPEQVVGSSIRTGYAVREDGTPVLERLAELNFIDDKAGKPVGIHEHIGRRPTMAFGNSDGDFQMLEWTTAGDGPRFGMLVHHTDSVREWAYDRESHIGRLDRGLDEAEARGWVVADMARDWATVYGE